MFKRLHATGGVAYVIGGIGALATVPAVAMFTLGALGVSVSSSLLMYSVIVFIIGAMVAAVVFNTGTMQVVAQNHTTATLEKISQQLAEQAAADNPHRRNNRRPRQRKQAQEESAVAQVQESGETSVAEAAPQEGYHCPVTKAFIPVR